MSNKILVKRKLRDKLKRKIIKENNNKELTAIKRRIKAFIYENFNSYTLL